MSEQAQHRKFPHEPSNIFLDSVCEHIAKTGEPETISDLFQEKIHKTESFEIMRDITIDKKKRPNGNMVSCPMCGHSNQFLKGYLCWFSELQFVAIIGRDCAGHEALAEAKRNYKSKLRKTISN
jgi:hypothetical protein